MASKGYWDLGFTTSKKQLSITIHGSCLFMIYMDYHNNIYMGSLFDMVYIFLFTGGTGNMDII